MDQDAQFQDYPAYTEKSSNKGKFFAIFFVTVLLIAGVVGGLYFMGANQQTEEPEIAVIPTLEPTATPDPEATNSAETSDEDLEKSDLTVDVLNGSGVAGAAGGVAATLRSAGYTIGSTGNGDNFDYEGITIVIKSDKKAFLKLLQADLEDVASGSAITSETSDDISADAEVIVGQ